MGNLAYSATGTEAPVCTYKTNELLRKEVYDSKLQHNEDHQDWVQALN
jgi:hypothetical protein